MDEAAHNMNNISKLNHVGVTYYTLLQDNKHDFVGQHQSTTHFTYHATPDLGSSCRILYRQKLTTPK